METMIGILLVFLFIRWLIWNRRYKALKAELTLIKKNVQDLQAEIVEGQEPAPAVSEGPTEVAEVVVEPAVPAMEPAEAETVEYRRPSPEFLPQVERAVPAQPPAEVAAARPSLRERLAAFLARRGLEDADWEILIGGRWLNKIGVVVLVIGVALFLGYSLQYFGPIGKIATGLVTSLVLLVAGVSLERIEKYRLFAKPLIGGGWALLYFTAYAAHNVEAARVIQEPRLGFLLLSLVAAGMILHSLKYRSEVVTGLAYALAFLAVAISPLSTYSLVASSILAASLLAILRKIPWYHLGPLGLAATYLNHLLWLRSPPVGVPPADPTQLFWLNQGMLVLYWLLFTSFAFVRRPETDRQEKVVLITNLANTLGFLGLSVWQVRGMFPDHLYVLTGGVAMAYVVTCSLLRVTGRYKLHLLDGSVAVGLIAMTIPLALRSFSLTNDWLAMALLVEAGIVLALGFYLREVVFRVEAYLLSLVVLGALFIFNFQGVLEGRNLVLWLTVMPAIAYFYYLFEQLQRKAGQRDVRQAAGIVGIVCGYAATALMATLLWIKASPELVGLAWLGAGLVLFEAGRWFPRSHLRGQVYILSALSLCALLAINLYSVFGQPAVGTLPRWGIVPPAILAFYYLFWQLNRAAAQGILSEKEKGYAGFLPFAGTILLTVLLWKELDAVAVALAWGALGLVLFEVGSRLNQRALRTQGHLLAALAFGRLFLANFTAPGEVMGLSHRLITVVPIGVMFYYIRFRVTEEREAGKAVGFENRLTQAYSYGAAVLLVVLVRFEFGRSHAVMMWGVLVVLFLTLGVLLRDRDFRIQSYLLAALTFGRSWSTNLYLVGSFYGFPERIATTVPVIAAFLAAALLWRSQRGVLAEAPAEGIRNLLVRIDANATALFSLLAAVLGGILLYYEVDGNLLTIAWTIEAFALLALGFLVLERSFRFYGLGLLLVCVLKVVVIDLQGVETLYRILSFIVLGIILLVASFAYTRYRRHQQTPVGEG